VQKSKHKLKILYFGNNWLGLQILKYLKSKNENIAGIVIQLGREQKHAADMIRISQLPKKLIIDADTLHQRKTMKKIKSISPDMGISVLFRHILSPELLSLFPSGVINLHPSKLPYNRGQYPNVWSIIGETPAGTSIHYINEDIDAGDVISQLNVEISPIDTGETLYHKLEKASIKLFKKSWPQIKSGKVQRIAQDVKSGTTYRARDVEKIDEIHLKY